MSSQTLVKESLVTPSQTTVKVTYDCLSPALDSPLRKLDRPLPLQANATGNLEWATAFIDHSGFLIKTQEFKFEELSKKYDAARNTIGRNETDLETLKKRNSALNKRIEGLLADNARQVTAHRKLDEAFDKFRINAKNERRNITRQLNATTAELNAARNSVRSLKAKLGEADEKAYAAWASERASDVEDHKVIADLQADLAAQVLANATLREQFEHECKQLRAAEHELHAANDRLAHYQAEINELDGQIETLKCEIKDRDRSIRRHCSDNEQLRQQNTVLAAKEAQLCKDLASKTTQLEKLQGALKKAQEDVKKLDADVGEQKKTIERLNKQRDDDKEESTRVLEDLRATSERTVKGLVDNIEQLQKHNEQDDEDLKRLQELVTSITFALEEARANDKSDADKIEMLQQAAQLAQEEYEAVIARLKKDIGDLREHDAKDHFQMEKKDKLVTERMNQFQILLATVAKEKAESDRKAKELADQVEDLNVRVAVATSDDASDKEKNRILTEAYENAKRGLKDLKDKVEVTDKNNAELQKQASDAEARRKAAEEAAEKLKAELKEMPNDVKLVHPIALVGSLCGAPRDVDDETFSINCPFPVTLFNASSSKIFVSTNGLFTLDYPSKIYGYQQLPYSPWFAEGLPDYVLAPFWADLYIYKNTPQGVYYEVTGEAPKRTLEVEWYVSRYNSPKQYYHFSVMIEEAKPNLATFKYFEALDKGGKCTIGVQGRKTGKTFSYNQEKVTPGTQVTFDTSKNTFETSTFKIAAPATKKLAEKASVAKDIKPVQAVTTTVCEVVDVD